MVTSSYLEIDTFETADFLIACWHEFHLHVLNFLFVTSILILLYCYCDANMRVRFTEVIYI